MRIGETNIKIVGILQRSRLRSGPRKQLPALLLLALVVSLSFSALHARTARAFGTGAPVTGIAGKCLANKNGTTTPGNKIQIETCDSSTKQVWQWQGDMSMRVQGMCLDVQTSGTAPGTVVQLWTCNGTGAQRWYTQADGTLKNQNSNLCLQTVGSASTDGTGVEINTCNASAAQLWTIPSDAMVKVPLFDGAAHNPLPSGPFNTPQPTITLDYSQMPQWGDYMEQVAKPFMQQWYQAMADHYLPGKSVIPAFTVKVDPTYNGGAATVPQTRNIWFNPGEYGYTTRQSVFQGTLVHEMHHMMIYNEARGTSGLPTWLVEGLADDARYNFYGVQKITASPDALFVSGYVPTEAVLTRAQQQSGNTMLSAINNAGWNNTFTYDLFKQVSGSTPAEHWMALTNDDVDSEVGTVKNSLSGKCLNVPPGGDVRLQIFTCSTTTNNNQNWAYKVTQGSTTGILTGSAAAFQTVGRCLSVDNNATTSGAAVWYRTCNSASNAGQKWQYVGGTLRNPNSGKCLQPVGGAQADNTQLEIQPCDGSTIQQWTLPTIVKKAAAPVTSKVFYPATFSDGQQGIGTTDAKGNGYNRVLTAPSNNTYGKPTVSPNGSKVAFYQTTNGQQTSTLLVANADGTSSTQLNTTGYFISTSASQPLWSTDNSKVLVAVTPTGQTATDKQWIWLWVNVDGSGQQTVSTSVIGGTPFAVTSSKIFYVNDLAIAQQLCSVNGNDGSGQTCFGQALVPKAVALSSAGDRVASVATGTTTSIQVTSVGASTSSTISLTGLGTGLTDVDNLTWVPQTTKIAFHAMVNGKSAWYAIDAANPGQISKLNINANAITWYANGAPALVYGAFSAVSPFRVTDTRASSGQLNANKTLAQGATLDVQVTGLGGVPAEGVSAVVLNITEAVTNANGFITVYPAGTTRPIASTLNNTAGKILNNQTTVGVSADGKVSIFNQLGNTDIIVDVVGYYSENGGSFTPTSPTRVIDSRSGAALGPNSTRDVQITGVQGIPSNAVSVVTDVTEVSGSAVNFLTLYPSGTPAPNASSLNYSTNETITKEVTVKLGTNGALTVKNGATGSTHFIIDVVGYYTADMGGLVYSPINPTRIADTRAGSGQPYAGQPIGSGATKLFTIGSSVMPANAAGVVNNLTMASATAYTFVTAFPADVTTVPSGTTVTYINPIAFNQSTVPLSSGPSGGFKVYNLTGTTDMVIDTLGYYY